MLSPEACSSGDVGVGAEAMGVLRAWGTSREETAEGAGGIQHGEGVGGTLWWPSSAYTGLQESWGGSPGQ